MKTTVKEIYQNRQVDEFNYVFSAIVQRGKRSYVVSFSSLIDFYENGNVILAPENMWFKESGVKVTDALRRDIIFALRQYKDTNINNNY